MNWESLARKPRPGRSKIFKWYVIFFQKLISNSRSNLELKSARRLAGSRIESNTEKHRRQVGLAVTLMRLAEIRRSAVASKLDGQPRWCCRIFAKSVRAELNMLTGQEPQAKRDLVDSRGLKIPEAPVASSRLCQDARVQDYGKLCGELVQNSAYEVIASLQHGLDAHLTQNHRIASVARHQRSAIGHRSSGGDDWHCHLTSAVCLAANADKDAAIAACQRAAELAIGNKKQLCLEICDQIRLGKDVVCSIDPVDNQLTKIE